MIEKHPFGAFVPAKAKYLLLGSFTARNVKNYIWFYANGRNQFWPIMEKIYGVPLKDVNQQQRLFSELKMAITDIILACERKKDSSMDAHLTNLVFNTNAIGKILKENPIERIYFSSKFVEKLFKREFKKLNAKHSKVELITLPSPSPRYAAMSILDKVKIYKSLLPLFKYY